MPLNVEIMWIGLVAKFTQNPALMHMLQLTGSYVLIEHSKHDKFWGATKTSAEGENVMGKLLMRLRATYASTSTQQIL